MQPLIGNKPRIEFIDLAKGLCILLVVMVHCDVYENTAPLSRLRMPLYFVLSGLFFKTYGSIKNLVLKKTNKLLIPMLTFYLLGEIVYRLAVYIKPELFLVTDRSVFDLFTTGYIFNQPIWFLLALFWCNLLFFLISTMCKSEMGRILMIALMGTIGYQLGMREIRLPLFIDVAMTSLPLFCVGYYLKQTPLLYPNRYDRYNWCFALFFGFIATIGVFVPSCGLNMFYQNRLSGGLLTYVFSVTSVLCILYICKIIKRIPGISYVGRYSVIILVLHAIIRRPVEAAFWYCLGRDSEYTAWGAFIVVMLINIACIPICCRYIPWLVAQKDIIKTA